MRRDGAQEVVVVIVVFAARGEQLDDRTQRALVRQDRAAILAIALGIGEAPGAGGAPGAGEAPGAVTLLRGARQSDVPGVIAYPNERGMREAGARGERPGDRTRGVSARAIRAVADLAVARL